MAVFALCPVCQDLTGFSPDVFVYCCDNAVLLEDRNELERRDETFFGMLPSYENFTAFKMSVCTVLGLQLRNDLTFFQS